jgi:hypothetical protein
MGPYAGVDCNLTLCPLQSRLQHVYIVQPCAKSQPYARVDFIPSQGLWIWPLRYKFSPKVTFFEKVCGLQYVLEGIM